MTVAQLPNVTDGSMLHCRVCGEDYSSDRSDYFLLPPTQILKCHRRVLKLVYRKTVYVDVQTGVAL